MASFEATAPGEHAKVWAQLLRALSKVGNDLFLEIYDSQLVLRTLNTARSAFATTSFKSAFFNTYELYGEVDKCKILLKPVVSAFKNTHNIEEFRINYDCDASSLTFELRCRNGIVKKYRVNYEVCDVLQAVYSKERCPSRVNLSARPLADCLSNFHSSVEEVTMAANGSSLQWTGGGGPNAGLATESSFNSRDFDKFKISGDVSLTFGLRELKALVSFWEGLSCSISIHFDSPGGPIIFSGSYHDYSFETDIVIATLGDVQDQESSQQTQSIRDSQQVSQSQGHSKPENVSQFSPAPQHSMGSNTGGDRISSLDSLEMSNARHERERISSFRSSDMDGGEEQESIGSVGTPRGARDRGGSGAQYDKGAHRGNDQGNHRDKRGRSPDADEEGQGRGGSRRGRGSPPTVRGGGVGMEEDGGDEEESEGEVVEATPTPPE